MNNNSTDSLAAVVVAATTAVDDDEEGATMIPVVDGGDGGLLLLEDDYYKDYYNFGTTDVTGFYITRIASAISILAGICIIVETFRSTLCVHRILFWMQCGLLLHSFATIWGTTPIYDHEFWGAHGNTATCNVQGLGIQLGGSLALLWDMALSSTFLLIVKYNWNDAKLNSLMKIFHCIIWPFALSIAIPPLFMDLYNPNWDLCWLSAYPPDCEIWDDDIFPDCTRGTRSAANIFDYINLSIGLCALLVSAVCMAILYCHVRGMENRNLRYSFGHHTTNTNSRYSTTTYHSTNTARASQTNNNNEHSNTSTAEAAQPAAAGTSTTTTNTTTRERSAPTTTTTTRPRRSGGNTEDYRRRSRAVAIQGILYSATIIVANLPTVISDYYSPSWFLLLSATTGNLYAFYYLLVFLRMRPKLKTRYGKFINKILCNGCHCDSNNNSSNNNNNGTRTSTTISRWCNKSCFCWKTNAAAARGSGEYPLEEELQNGAALSTMTQQPTPTTQQQSPPTTVSSTNNPTTTTTTATATNAAPEDPLIIPLTDIEEDHHQDHHDSLVENNTIAECAHNNDNAANSVVLIEGRSPPSPYTDNDNDTGKPLPPPPPPTTTTTTAMANNNSSAEQRSKIPGSVLKKHGATKAWKEQERTESVVSFFQESSADE